MPSELTTLRPTPLYFLGDSTTLVFADHLYRRPSTQEYFIGRSIYMNDATSASFFDKEGLSAAVVSSMEAHGLLVRDVTGIEAFHLAPQLHWKRVARALARPRDVPYLVLSIGGIDVVRFLRELKEKDFDLPVSLLHRDLAAPGCLETRPPALSHAAVEELVAPAISGLDGTISGLQNLGFTKLFVNSLLPYTLDDAYFRHYLFLDTSLAMRYKALLLFNHLIHAICVRRGIQFVDCWSRQIDSGYAKQNLFIDEIHLTPSQAAEVVEVLFESLDRLRTGAVSE